MRYREVRPAPALRHLVHCYWTMERDYRLASAPVESVWPDGRVELLLHYGDRYRLGRACGPGLDHGVILGPLTRRLALVSPGRIRIVGVRFHPWGLAGLLGLPADQLTDAVVPVEDLFGGAGRRLAERVGGATEGEALALIERFLIARLRPLDRGLGAIAALAGELRRHPAGAGRAALDHRSRRQVERLFKRAVGLSPKRFAVIARFDAVRRHLVANPLDDVSDVAFRFGYYDYSHLSRDFDRFLGMTPHALRTAVTTGHGADIADVAFVQDGTDEPPPAWAP